MGGLDLAAHLYGPGSPLHEAEVLQFWATLDTVLEDLQSSNTLFLFTADHGHIGVPAEQTLYINERWPELASWLATSPTGETIWPNGSPRDMFLHLRRDRVRAALELLGEGLAGIAEVLPVERALAEGLFGPQPISAELRRRLGDALVLPHLGHFIWWRQPGLIENRFHGHHGGLTPEELITVLGASWEI